MGSFLSREHPPQCAVVLSICIVLPRLGGNDAGTGVAVEHSTINRWVLKYAPELDKRIRPHLGEKEPKELPTQARSEEFEL